MTVPWVHFAAAHRNPFSVGQPARLDLIHQLGAAVVHKWAYLHNCFVKPMTTACAYYRHQISSWWFLQPNPQSIKNLLHSYVMTARDVICTHIHRSDINMQTTLTKVNLHGHTHFINPLFPISKGKNYMCSSNVIFHLKSLMPCIEVHINLLMNGERKA